LSLKLPIPARIPLLYLILAVLLAISVVPMYFYSTQIETMNRERLKTNEMLLQNTVTRSLADDIFQHQEALHMMLANLSSSIQVMMLANPAQNDLNAQSLPTPELRAMLENFVSSAHDIDYATLLNADAKGVYAGNIEPDAFLQRELERAFQAARDGRVFSGQPLTVGSGKSAHTVMLVSSPVTYDKRFLGMIASVVDMDYLIRRLRQVGLTTGLMPYVVDSQGRLVAAATSQYATGQEMNHFDIVRSFVSEGTKAQLAETREFTVTEGKNSVEMLGTYSPVTSLDWAVVVQKPREDAYRGIYEMQRTGRLLALLAVFVSVGLSILSARRITSPLQVLAHSSRAVARGDFSQRVHVKTRTEIGELATTFNTMSEELEHFVLDLKRAAEENKALFIGSIQMLAGAVDEKDPYTRGHSDRVTKYSLLVAKELGADDEFMEIVRISAQLHDVGKIGIEDRILKKPGALTPEEFEVMKTHTTKGANILRPVPQLSAMLPGIELHHEALNGRGYPYGLKGDEIPLLARVIAVADTFDALTTNRPYQKAYDPVEALGIIQNLSGQRLDPKAVAALLAVYQRGEIIIQKPIVVPVPIESPAMPAAHNSEAQPLETLHS
jgi:HD-GYP domain-containing protein (c-di-GMP phosphodiesterase class II)